MPNLKSDGIDQRPTILVLFFYFCRGVDATGPNQSLLNMATALPEYRFRFIGTAVSGDAPNRWQLLKTVEHLPLRRAPLGRWGLIRALRNNHADLIILNSFFDPRMTIPALVLRRLHIIPRVPVLLAPRGEFFSAALGSKSMRKRFYIGLVKRLGLLQDVSLQATSEEEAARIQSMLPFAGPVLLGPNVRPLPPMPPFQPRSADSPLRVAIVGRITRIKNIGYAIDVLAQSNLPTFLNIYGPIEDVNYWRECQLVAKRAANLTVIWHGQIPSQDVISAISANDLFIQPSLGENYGHSIVDAFIAGTPVLISDQTPWRGLEPDGVGWDLALNEKSRFVEAVREMFEMPPQVVLEKRARIRGWAQQKLKPAETTTHLRLCLQKAMGRK